MFPFTRYRPTAEVLTKGMQGYNRRMELHLSPELELKLEKLATETGRPKNDLLGDVLSGYFDELTQVREMLNSRYNDVKSGRVKPLDGETFFKDLRQREQELLKRRSPQ